MSMEKLTVERAQRIQDEGPESIPCPMCDTNDAQVLGVLGIRLYFLCRACGWEFSFKPNW